MRAEVVGDIWGSWGGSDGKKKHGQPDAVQEIWSIREHSILEEGPARVSLWTRWEGRNSWMDLTFFLGSDGREIRVKGRMLLNERSSRVNLVLPVSGAMFMQVPGSEVERNQPGHLPCGRWFRCGTGEGSVGFVSDVLSDVVAKDKETHVTLARASRYADDVPTIAGKEKWLPAADCGELKFEFWLAPGTANLAHLAQELMNPPVVVYTPAHPGALPDTGSLARLEPEHLSLLAAHLGTDGDLHIRVQNLSKKTANGRFVFGDRSFSLGVLSAFQIKTTVVQAGAGAQHKNGAVAPRFKQKLARKAQKTADIH